MSSWHSLTFNFAPFEPLQQPLQTILTVLETVEAILEALLDLIRAFFLDLLNPIKAAVALLLAAVRAIINQIISSGFSILLVHPDFSQPDAVGLLNSVSGGYPAFESKVIGKFYDTGDLFRPMYAPGSSTAMLILYIGTDSPGDLLGQLFALLSLIKHPLTLPGLPAPVGVTVRPVNKSGSAVSQFQGLFSSDLQKALVVEWRMPGSPSGIGVLGLIGQATSLYNSFRFPSFIVERTDSQNPRGKLVPILPDSVTLGKSIDSVLDRYKFPAVKTKYVVKDESGNVYRDFGKKMRATGSSLAEGALTGSYKFVDDDPSLEAGKTYYYRVRAFFGEPSEYLSLTGPDSLTSKKGTILVRNGNQWFIRPDRGSTLGKVSSVVKGVVPVPLPDGSAFNPYNDLYDAVRVGLLLNFEFPAAKSSDTPTRTDQKTGWGALGVIGGQIGPIKAAVNTSTEFKDSFIVKTISRRISNSVLDKLTAQPKLLEDLGKKWTGGVQSTVRQVLDTDTTWQFIGIIGGVTDLASTRIDSYLAREDIYINGNPYHGPLPVRSSLTDNISVGQRTDLANFLRSALALLSYQTSYLVWFSVTIGDLFPALIPFLNQFEQFILSLLKALENALAEILEIIETLLQKVRALEQIIQTIIDIISLLSINISISILAVSSTNGSADQLVADLQASEDKPGNNPFGLHSGLVLTFGGPGPGFTAAFKALSFLLGLGL